MQNFLVLNEYKQKISLLLLSIHIEDGSLEQ